MVFSTGAAPQEFRQTQSQAASHQVQLTVQYFKAGEIHFFKRDPSGDEGNQEGSKRHSLQAVELSQRTQAAVQIVSKLPAPSNGGPIYHFWGIPAMQTRWMAGAVAHKSG